MAGIEAQTSTEDLSVLTNREEIQEAVALFKDRLTHQAAEHGVRTLGFRRRPLQLLHRPQYPLPHPVAVQVALSNVKSTRAPGSQVIYAGLVTLITNTSICERRASGKQSINICRSA